MLPRSSNGRDWDDCDIPLLKPYHFTSVDGIKSGLVKPIPTAKLSTEADPSKITSDIAYQHKVFEDHRDSDLLFEESFRLYSPEEENALPLSLIAAANNRLSFTDIMNHQQSLKNARNNTMPFFFYGAQMFPSIILTTTGLQKSHLETIRGMTPGLVRGFKRHAIRDRAYPAVIRSNTADDSVAGMVVFGIPDKSRQSIHDFQGGSYQLRRVEVVLRTSDRGLCTMECGMYILKRTLPLVPTEQATWKPSDLMKDQWHLRNLQFFQEVERGLETTQM